MRYYKIVIKSASGSVVTPPGFEGLLGDATYTSFANNQTLPGAWQVELDVPVAPFAAPAGSAWVRVWGVSLAEISQANDLNGLAIQVYAGMQKGLPLANPAQAGLIVQGIVFQAYGNWVGLDQTLDLQITTGIPSQKALSTGEGVNPGSLVLNWKAGSQMSSAIQSALQTVFPGLKINVNISPNLVQSVDGIGFYSTLGQLADYVKAASSSILGGSYRGVDISINGDTINVSDGTATSNSDPIQLNFQDLVGQPTWIGPQTMQFRTVMRADLQIDKQILMPKGGVLVATTPQTFSSLRQSSGFQGKFQIQSLHHVGNFRQPDAAAWVTNVDAFPVTQ